MNMTVKSVIARASSPWNAGPSGLALAVVLVFPPASLAEDDGEVFRAVEHGDAEALVEAIAHGGDVASRDTYESTPLHMAAVGGYDTLARILIDAGADVEARTDEGDSPLLLATKARNASTVLLLVDSDADVAARNHRGQAPLHWAVNHGLLDVAQVLLDAGAPLDASTHVTADEGHFGTALTVAAGKDDLGAVRWLVDRGASVNPPGAGVSPVHEAARGGHDAIAAYLIDQGAGVQGTDGIDLLDTAREDGLRAVLDRLVGPDPVPRTATPAQLARWLLFAIHADEVGRVGALLDSGAPVNFRYEADWTPLHYALLGLKKGERSADVAMMLIERGADATAATAGIGWTPLHFAAILNGSASVETLIGAGADVNAVTSVGRWTPMRVAEWGRAYGFNRRPPRSGTENPEARAILAAVGGTIASIADVGRFELYLGGDLMNWPKPSRLWHPHQLHNGMYAAPVQGYAGGSRTVHGAFTTPGAKERLVFEDIGFAHHGESLVDRAGRPPMALVSKSLTAQGRIWPCSWSITTAPAVPVLIWPTCDTRLPRRAASRAGGNLVPVMATDRYMEFQQVCLDPDTRTHLAVFLVHHDGSCCPGVDLAYMRYGAEASTLTCADTYDDDTAETLSMLDRIRIDGNCLL